VNEEDKISPFDQVEEELVTLMATKPRSSSNRKHPFMNSMKEIAESNSSLVQCNEMILTGVSELLHSFSDSQQTEEELRNQSDIQIPSSNEPQENTPESGDGPNDLIVETKHLRTLLNLIRNTYLHYQPQFWSTNLAITIKKVQQSSHPNFILCLIFYTYSSLFLSAFDLMLAFSSPMKQFNQ
jgi:hypothetical protein